MAVGRQRPRVRFGGRTLGQTARSRRFAPSLFFSAIPDKRHHQRFTRTFITCSSRRWPGDIWRLSAMTVVLLVRTGRQFLLVVPDCEPALTSPRRIKRSTVLTESESYRAALALINHVPRSAALDRTRDLCARSSVRGGERSVRSPRLVTAHPRLSNRRVAPRVRGGPTSSATDRAGGLIAASKGGARRPPNLASPGDHHPRPIA